MMWSEVVQKGYDTFLKNHQDLEYVVRCKDCKYYKKLKDVDGLKFCSYVIGAEFVREFDDYCSRGERKETEDE